MNDRSNEARLQRMKAPPPDSQARLLAKRAALAEFARVNAAAAANESVDSQASAAPERLSRQESRGRFAMNWLVPRGWSGAFASLCVVALGVTLLWPMVSRNIDPVKHVEAEDAEVAPLGETGAELQPGTTPAPAPATLAKERVEAMAPDAEPAQKDDVSRSVVETPRAVNVPTDSREARKLATEKPATSGRVGSPAPPAPPVPAAAEEVVVTGHRRPLQASQEVKHEAMAVVDAIQSEDIGRVSKRSAGNPKMAANGAGANARSKDGTTVVYANAGAASGFIVEPGVLLGQPTAGAEDNDKFRHFDVNPIKRVAQDPVSTFSVDVDTASYAFVRRALNSGSLPPQDSVRVEEMINYFDYAWPLPRSRAEPFQPTIVVSDSPWNKGKKLVHVAIKGYEVPRDDAPDANLVLLLDVSGSMNSPDKLPLAVQSMELLLGSLKPADTIGIVVYAGAAGMVLEPTPVREKSKILAALRSLTPGGSTAGAAGIELAYKLAESNFRKGGVNRILLATDGDFNVGISNTEQLKGFVERKREHGVMLSVLGFGQGNYRDELSQALAQNGNGVAAYIDSLSEAQKVLVQEASGTLFTIAKDVKIQVEFNPATVSEYRLVGYETRALNREDFNNDAVDAGDVGAGHSVTAIYEITPVGSGAESVDPLRYGSEEKRASAGSRAEYGFLKMRYKLPDERRSKLIEKAIPLTTDAASLVGREVRFSTAVAGFGQLLRGGAHAGGLSLDDVIREAQATKGDDEFGYRTEFVQLVRKAQTAKGM
jgi:Ca-activated chloride channel family protein